MKGGMGTSGYEDPDAGDFGMNPQKSREAEDEEQGE